MGVVRVYVFVMDQWAGKQNLYSFNLTFIKLMMLAAIFLFPDIAASKDFILKEAGYVDLMIFMMVSWHDDIYGGFLMRWY